MSATTRVGIVEWARRIERARATEMWLAESLGWRVAEASDAAAKVAVVRRARLHAWHADLWKSVAPLLHDFRADGDAAPSVAAGAVAEDVLETLDEDYRTWRDGAGPVAEAPIIRVLGLVMRDHADSAET